MKYCLLSFLAIFLTATFCSAEENKPIQLPADVAAFARDRDGCDHFRGEPPYDEERQAFLLQQMKKLCTGTDDKLEKLKEKYQDNAEIMELLDDYEERIEF